MKRVAKCFRVIVVALVLVTPAAAAQQPAGSGAERSPAATAPPDGLRPGDVVRLRIWREPDLSGEFAVDEHGVAMLPRLGATRVTGEAIDSLRAKLVRAYEGYLREPTIEIVPLRRIRVTGAVRNPGLYTVDATMSVADALALAGGASPQGRRDRVLLIRGDTSIDARLAPREGSPHAPLRSGDQLFVPERSWISRNPGVLIGAVSAAASMVWAITRLSR